MARLPIDSFLPSGSFHDSNELSHSLSTHSNRQTNSVVDALALPRSNQVSYFDDQNLASHPASHYMHTPDRSRLRSPAHQEQQQRFLSPHRDPSTNGEVRSSSRSPTRYQIQSQNPAFTSGLTSPSLSASAVSPPVDQTASQNLGAQLRRLTLHNRRLVENWEAERTHLEANRARAEEIYKEERAIMDEERMDWVEREAAYLAKIAALERDNAALLDLVNKMQGTAANSSHLRDATDAGAQSSKVRSPPDGLSPGVMAIPVPINGATMPESKPFIPLDPRMQSASPAATPPGTTPPKEERIPPIDVQEIHPELEGIPIKATAVQKPTFAITTSLSPGPGSKKTSPLASNGDQDSPTRSKASPAELTKEALMAPEITRLTMHAGHTPNHSLSRFPTVLSTAPDTAGSSGRNTPTCVVDRDTREDDSDAPAAPKATAEGATVDTTEAEAAAAQEVVEEDDDKPLQEPMMLRNSPVKDEPFLRTLSDRLETVVSENSLPTVLRHSEVTTTVDGADEKTENSGGAKSEPDPPLKFKSTSNFGAAFGSLSGL